MEAAKWEKTRAERVGRRYASAARSAILGSTGDVWLALGDGTGGQPTGAGGPRVLTCTDGPSEKWRALVQDLFKWLGSMASRSGFVYTLCLSKLWVFVDTSWSDGVCGLRQSRVNWIWDRVFWWTIHSSYFIQKTCSDLIFLYYALCSVNSLVT